MTNLDILKAAISWLAVSLGTLAWVFFSRQSLVARKPGAAVAIAIRIAIVHAAVIPVLCIGGGIPIDYLAIPLAMLLVLAPLLTFQGLGNAIGDDAFGAAILAVFVLPPYIIKQFVLGFPDRGEFVLEPPGGEPREKSAETGRNLLETDELTELIGTVVTPLKPFGYIDLDGQRVAASSATGVLIDVGQPVRVHSRTRAAVVVELADNPDPTP